jgi:hypothetical protein
MNNRCLQRNFHGGGIGRHGGRISTQGARETQQLRGSVRLATRNPGTHIQFQAEIGMLSLECPPKSARCWLNAKPWSERRPLFERTEG